MTKKKLKQTKSKIKEKGIAGLFGFSGKAAAKEKSLDMGSALKKRKMIMAEKIINNPRASPIEKLRAQRILEKLK